MTEKIVYWSFFSWWLLICTVSFIEQLKVSRALSRFDAYCSHKTSTEIWESLNKKHILLEHAETQRFAILNFVMYNEKDISSRCSCKWKHHSLFLLLLLLDPLSKNYWSIGKIIRKNWSIRGNKELKLIQANLMQMCVHCSIRWTLSSDWNVPAKKKMTMAWIFVKHSYCQNYPFKFVSLKLATDTNNAWRYVTYIARFIKIYLMEHGCLSTIYNARLFWQVRYIEISDCHDITIDKYHI